MLVFLLQVFVKSVHGQRAISGGVCGLSCGCGAAAC